MLVGSSPGHFAANRVLRRLSLPRHPPHALSSLTSSRQQIKVRPPPTRLSPRLRLRCAIDPLGSTTMRFSMFTRRRNVDAEGTSPLRLAPTTLSPYLQSRVDQNRFELSVRSPCFRARFMIPMSQRRVKHPPRFSWRVLSLTLHHP